LIDCALNDDDFRSKSSLSSPLTGTLLFDYDILMSKIDNCGVDFDEYFPPDSNESRVLPVFCDNRICDNPDCKQHRLYKYMRYHRSQIKALQGSMRNPKAWIFTGWVVPVYELDRGFVQDKLRYLFKILSSKKYGSSTEFSIHMELKVYPEGHRNYGCFYVHFHVVSGGMKDLRMVRCLWKRQVCYEEAIRSDALGYYVSKYASKTPTFPDDNHRYCYAMIVYKLQMHRFSSGRSEFIASGWLCLSRIENEVRNSLYRDYYLNPSSKNCYYFKFLESVPPPVSFLCESDLYEADFHISRKCHIRNNTVSKGVCFRVSDDDIVKFWRSSGCIE
jgi:hypothetical protein